jgi:hypothetical protein
VAAEIYRLQDVRLSGRICAKKTNGLEQLEAVPFNNIVGQFPRQGRFGVPGPKIDTNPVSYGEKVL